MHLLALEKAPPPPPNIRSMFLTANATSLYQPFGQDIIQNLKHYHRKSWMWWVIGMLDRVIDPRERMSLNYTLRWLSGAWRNKNETIQNSFIVSTVLPGRRLSDQVRINQDIALDPELRPLHH